MTKTRAQQTWDYINRETKNKAASELASFRWAKLSETERKAAVPKNGGRKRIYPKCERYKAHRFVNNRCPCGFVRGTRPIKVVRTIQSQPFDVGED